MQLEVYFDALEKSVMQELSKAKVYVKVAVAWITFRNYEQLFIELSKKGVKIEILVSDSPQLRERQMTTANSLIKHGITVIICKMPSSSNYMHHKFAVIDDSVVINGSFNWSANAAMSFENLMVIRNDKKWLRSFWQSLEKLRLLIKKQLVHFNL